MSKRLLSIAGAVVLSFAAAGLALAQDTTTTTTSTVTQTVQNPDGSYTVIEYPAGKQVIVDLTPTTVIPGAKGTATVIRSGNTSKINLNLSGLTGDTTSFNLYAVDPTGAVTSLGPINVTNGTATQTFTTPLSKFMLVLSPKSDLTSITPDTPIVLRSAVPSGFAVVPYAAGRPKTDAIHANATTTAAPTPAYNVPMLNVPTFKMNAWNRVMVNFSGQLAGSRATILVRPRRDQTTEVHANFHDLMRAPLPAGTRLVLWAVAPDNTYTKLGQVIATGNRNKADIHSETSLKDFGLLVTAEPNADVVTPSGQIYGTTTVIR